MVMSVVHTVKKYLVIPLLIAFISLIAIVKYIDINTAFSCKYQDKYSTTNITKQKNIKNAVPFDYQTYQTATTEDIPRADNRIEKRSNFSVLRENVFSMRDLHIPTGMQQSRLQVEITVAEILRVRRKKGHCNLLVFGLGYDSIFWRDINSQGKTIFLEDSQAWIDKVKKRYREHLKVFKVTYNTQIGRDRSKFQDLVYWPALRMALPSEVELTEWDIVMVDAPMGGGDSNPGRWQSIYTAAHLWRPVGALTVIDDCDRHIENTFGLLVFGEKHLKRRMKRPSVSHAAANEQCYFWGSTTSAFTNHHQIAGVKDK